MELHTERCLIRNMNMCDADSLFHILSNLYVMQFIETPFDRKQTENFIRSAGLCDPPLVYSLIWKQTGSLIGHVIFHPFNNSSYEIGWILDHAHWNQGIATEITAALISYAKAAGIQNLILECDPGQTATKKIAEKLGFLPDSDTASIECYRLALI